MNTKRVRTLFSIGLGSALLLQAVTSLVSGVLFLGPFTDKSNLLQLVEATAAGIPIARIATLLDVATALGIIWLAVMLYRLTKSTHPVLATLALSLYLVEAGILLMSKVFALGFIEASIRFASRTSETALAAARILLDLKDISYTLHMIPCGIGAVLFYGLLFRARTLPRWLSLWGLITIIPVWISSVCKIFGMELPFLIALPYAPFEFFAAVYIFICGLPRASHSCDVSEGS